jgi:hypothetical protein
LEATRRYSPEAVFIFTSTNKIYGDTPNRLPLVELETRWELPSTHRFAAGIDETMTSRFIACSAFPSFQPICWFRNMDDISGCALLVSVVAALPVAQDGGARRAGGKAVRAAR